MPVKLGCNLNQIIIIQYMPIVDMKCMKGLGFITDPWVSAGDSSWSSRLGTVFSPLSDPHTSWKPTFGSLAKRARGGTHTHTQSALQLYYLALWNRTSLQLGTKAHLGVFGDAKHASFGSVSPQSSVPKIRVPVPVHWPVLIISCGPIDSGPHSVDSVTPQKPWKPTLGSVAQR